MEFESILYADTHPELCQKAPDFFQDLQLDYITDLIEKEAGGYHLRPYYYTLLQSGKIIRYRQQICRDLMNEDLCCQFWDFCIRMQRSRRSHSLSFQCEEEIQAASFHLEAASLYWQALLSLSRNLDSYELESEGLCSLRDFLKNEINTKKEAGFDRALQQANDFFTQIRFRLIVEQDRITIAEESGKADSFFQEAVGTALNMDHLPEYDAMGNYLQELATLTGGEAGTDGTVISGIFPNMLEPSCMETTLIRLLKRSRPDVFQEINQFYQAYQEVYDSRILQFEQEIPVYLSFMKFRKRTENLGYPLREPKLSQDGAFHGKDVYDLALVWKCAGRNYEVVSNDFTYPDHASFFTVTGPNQGGKTTFARSMGQAVYLSMMGLYVNASDLTIPFFHGIATHFEVEEKLQSNSGKLKEEIHRLVPMMNKDASRQFVILNELFTTATTHDAIIMGKEVMKHFLEKYCYGIYVTHIHELAVQSYQIISLVAQIEDDTDRKRTYRIRPMKAQGFGYSDSLVKEFELRYEDITRRLSRQNVRREPGRHFQKEDTPGPHTFLPNLLYRDSSMEGKKGYYSRRDIIKDLNLDIIFRTMAGEHMLVAEHVGRVMMVPLETPEEIRYRQEIMKDLCEHTELTDTLYEYAKRQQRALKLYKEEIEKGRMRSTSKTGEIIQKIQYLRQGLTDFISLRDRLEQEQEKFHAEGLRALVCRLRAEPFEELLARVEDIDAFIMGGSAGYLFRFGGGMKLSSAIVTNCEQSQTRTVRQYGPKSGRKRGLEKFYYKFIRKNTIPVNSEPLQKDVENLKEVTAQYMLDIFQPVFDRMMRFYSCFTEEIAFYKGAARFIRRMTELSIPLFYPDSRPTGTKDTSFKYLYELSMAVYLQDLPVGNNGVWENNRLTVVTGANQGGKSTFLRSYGIAQVLMQCGMPTPAQKFSAPVYRQIFTHFTRSEDEELSSGRLREELQRMSDMIQAAVPGSLFLLNESFASTTEKEGAHIAEGILRAFYENDITTFMVTHLFVLAKKLYQEEWEGAEFLTAERKTDGERTYHMLPGAPGHTSYGTDLFYSMTGKTPLYESENRETESQEEDLC